MNIKNYGYNNIVLNNKICFLTEAQLNTVLTTNAYYSLVDTETNLDNLQIHTDINLIDLASLFESNFNSIQIDVLVGSVNMYFTLRKLSEFGNEKYYQTVSNFENALVETIIKVNKISGTIQIKLSVAS